MFLFSAVTLEKKWKNMKTQFQRQYKTYKELTSVSGAARDNDAIEKVLKWPYFKQCSFLIPFKEGNRYNK